MTRVLIAGGGLAGSLVAWRLRQARPELQVDVVERGERLGGNHTWSFHETDLTRAEHGLLAPLVAQAVEHTPRAESANCVGDLEHGSPGTGALHRLAAPG